MNLRKMIPWHTSPAASSNLDAVHPATPKLTPPSAAPASADALSNVIQLPSLSPLAQPAGLEAAPHVAVDPAQTARLPAGLFGNPELKAFFEENFFGLGRHNGSFYKTQEALLQGKQSLVSRFQNTASAMVEQRQSKIDQLRNMQLQTEGVCPTTTAQLDLACSRLLREIDAMREQIALAANSKGWVLEALNRYQIGFGKGLREAVDFELLGN